MAKLRIFEVLVVLLSADVTLPIFTTAEIAEQNPCAAGDEACTELLPSIEEDDEIKGLNLLQHTASLHTRKAKTRAITATHLPQLFIEPINMGYSQLAFITAVYGYIFYYAANMIRDGSELLMFFKSGANLVGSVVVPILSVLAVCALVIVSGLGPNAQVHATTGIGVLVGSSTFLLTVPWFLVNMFGSVPLKDDGTADYKRNKELATLWGSGVTFGDSVSKAAKIMAITSLAVLVVQIPASFYNGHIVPIASQAAVENKAVFASFLICLNMFVWYVYMMYSAGVDDDSRVKVMVENIRKKQVSLSTVLSNLEDEDMDKNLPAVLNCFFYEFDEDKSGYLDCKEFQFILKELGEQVTPDQAKRIFDGQDKRGGVKDGRLSFLEFCKWAKSYKPSSRDVVKLAPTATSKRQLPVYHNDQEEAEEIIPDDFKDMSLEHQEWALFLRACGLITGGIFVVILFCAPVVHVCTEWGTRWGISSFYTGFLLAPIAANGNEAALALSYARAKTAKKATAAFDSIVSTVCINNTLVLAMFLAVIYFNNLAWTFKSETLAILIIEWMAALTILSSNTQKKYQAGMNLSLYWDCLMVVYICENWCGWD